MASKRITFSVDDELFEAARQKALAEGTTLDAVALKWLTDLAKNSREPERVD